MNYSESRLSTSTLRPFAYIALSVLATSSVQAAISWSGLTNIELPFGNSIVGLYLDLETADTSLVENELTSWDLNFVFGGEWVANSASLQPVRSGSGNSDTYLNLPIDTIVGSGSEFYATGFGGSTNHIGSEFVSGESGYLGFQFTPAGGSMPFYGWMEVSLSNNGSNGNIHQWAWDDTGEAIAVGAVPEISHFAGALGMVAIGLVIVRRRV
ncbi:MAG: hypothetical protein ACSHYA_09940 [Opitutaceae bacterium]